MNVIHAEWVRLRRPLLLLGTITAVAVLSMLTTVVTFLGAGSTTLDSESALPPPGPGGTTTLAELATTTGLADLLASSATLLGVVALGLAAAQFAGDYSHGTLRNLLVREPRRLRLLAGRYVAFNAFVLLLVGAAAITVVFAAMVAAPAYGVEADAWTTSAGLRAYASTTGNLLLSTWGYASLGVALGTLLRSPVLAIGVGVAWLLPLESILSAALEGAQRVLPGQLLSAVAAGGTADLAHLTALTTSFAFVALSLVAVAVLFRRRDVTV